MKLTDVENGYNECDCIIDWDDIFFDLSNEKAVLVLGPEFFTQNGKPVKQLLYEELIQQDNNGILHFYPSNGIFLFQSELYKTKAQKRSSQFYKSLDIDYSILHKITELPFRVIINTNPDRKLERTYKEKNIECQFDYFSWRPNKRARDIVSPDSYYPLIYNLFGSVDDYESIVLDYEDIFDHLKTLLNNTTVPDEVRSILSETDTYIFIGFHLQKWDTQLLFRYLNMKEHCFDDSKKNYTTRSNEMDNNSESFFRQQFNIKYYGAPVEFLEKLHENYFKAIGANGNIPEGNEEVKRIMEELLANDQIERALAFLTAQINDNNELKEILIMVKAKYANYIYVKSRNLDTKENLEIMRSRIRHSVLEFTALVTS